MAEQGWSIDLGRKLGLNRPVDFTAQTNGHFILHIPCSIDQKKHDFTIDKKLPPNVILKKLKQREWDVTKGRVRCPLCVHMKLKRRLVDTEAQPQLEVEEETFSLSKNDIRVETFRASGPGGQHVNATDSAVRVTHIPTGVHATVQSHRSQHQNRQQALATLTERVKQHYDKKEVDVPRQEHPDDIRLGISPGSIVVTIPESHELFSAFIGNDRKGNSHWKLELRSNPNLKGEPFIALVKTKLPPGKLRMRGLSVATYNRQTEAAVLAIKPKLYPEIIQRFGTFRSAPAEIRHVSQRGIDLQLPPSDERKPVILRGESKRLEEETRPTEPVVEHVPTPVPEPEKHLPAELPVRRTEPALTEVPHLTMPRRMYLEPVQAPIDVERAINFLNDLKKKKGDDLRFRMEEGGYLSYIMKGGHR